MSARPIFPLEVDSPVTAPLFPALRARIASLFGAGFDPSLNHGPVFFARFDRLVDADEDTLSDAPDLAEIGYALLEPENSVEMRRRGCIWLTLFPSLRMVSALARVVRDTSEPEALRGQALWSLAFRQIQSRSDALRWDEGTIVAADAVLRDAFADATLRTSAHFAGALRHVSSPSVLDTMASDPVFAARCVDAFATPTLARSLLKHLRAIGPEDGVRIVRLIASTLGHESVDPLLEYAKDAPVAERIEALFAAFVIDPQRTRAALDAFVASLMFGDRVRARLEWHASRPGVFPTVAALRVARTSACLAPAERSASCEHAASLFADAHHADMLSEAYLVDLWRHVAWRSRERAPQLLVAAVDASPRALADEPRVRDAYLASLAEIGRYARVEAVAREHGGVDLAAWLLAIHGRPLRALATRSLAPASAPRAIAAEALALFLTGRPDLATRTLEFADPRSEPLDGIAVAPEFPGPDERERIARNSTSAPMLRALVDRHFEPLFESMKSAPVGADPDTFDFTILTRFAEAPDPGNLRGATVYLAGRFVDEVALRLALETAGAQIVSGPFAKTAFYIRGDGADDAAIAKLEARGARPLPRRVILGAR